jgi:ATP-GRASP peptide maturase of grasp-with-spasm system
MEIVIYSLEIDNSTNEIIDWIKYFNSSVTIYRCNDLENLDCSFLNLNNIFYNRKSTHFFENNQRGLQIQKNDSKLKLLSHLKNESLKELKAYIEYTIISNRTTVIGNKKDNKINKLEQLDFAKKAKLKTPKSLVTSSKKELMNFFYKETNGLVINKPLYNGIMVNYKNNIFASYTTKLDKDRINKIPDNFLISFFQEQIIKIFEIRTFYFYGECYSMAIFSQGNSMTEIDFRNYDVKTPNRTVPYKLSLITENKIKNLMNSLNLNTGSIDFIYSETGEIYFLEVNPEGQFDMVSKPCNYFLEEIIAKKIILEYEKKIIVR